jgi:hypothetical protein
MKKRTLQALFIEGLEISFGSPHGVRMRAPAITEAKRQPFSAVQQSLLLP